MTAGRPREYNYPITFSATTDKAILLHFKTVCAIEGISLSHKLTEMMEEYAKIHGRGNPQYQIQQFIDNEEFRAVPALLEKKEKWLYYFDQSDTLEDIEQVEAQAEFLRKAAKQAKTRKLREAVNSLRGGGKPVIIVNNKALPEKLDPGAVRKESLRILWQCLARPDHDRKGGQAHRYRRNAVIQNILRVQELLPEYQKCQEYDEWQQSSGLDG